VPPWLSWWALEKCSHTSSFSRDLVLPPGVDLGANIGFTGLLLVLVVLAAAEAFRRGRKLADDTERLV
jgi:hypothetical protein